MTPWAIGAPAAGALAATSFAAWAATSPSSQVFGPTLRQLPANSAEPQLALTFDDGPNPAITPRLLQLFDVYNVRATFFVIGRYARACPELVREIAARGHLLGNHTQSHHNLIWLTPVQISRELSACRDAVLDALAGSSSALQPHMQWMRPPYGFRGPQLAAVARKITPAGVAMWSRVCHDWRTRSINSTALVAELVARLARAREREIVLLHDGDPRNADREHVVAALVHWLPRWHDAGLKFVTIPPAAGATPAS
jgi:peptidoglycan-N-acetylglucosamine deacetylase